MRPLEDLRIIAIEQYGAGPWGSLQLADLGAEVIKIEDPRSGGDVGRYVPPYTEAEDSLFFESLNRNKRSLSLDLTTASGRAVFEDLVREADAVYSNLRGDVPAKLRITYDDLKHLNPQIVCCSLSGFGMTGPRSTEPGYDYVVQAMAGWMSLTGEPDGPPSKSGLSIVDWSGGLVAALSLLAAVHQARRDGNGTDCDVSLYDTAIGMLNYVAAWQLNADFEPQRTRHSAHPSLVPFQAFAANDGWFVVACAKEKFWHRLTDVVGRPEWRTDPRFVDFASRNCHRADLLPLLEAILSTQTVEHWLALMRTAGVPCGPVHDVATALSDEHTLARGLVLETDHPRYGSVRQVASPTRVGERDQHHRRGPQRHEDADYVLHKVLGYDDDQMASLGRQGAFGPPRDPGTTT